MYSTAVTERGVFEGLRCFACLESPSKNHATLTEKIIEKSLIVRVHKGRVTNEFRCAALGERNTVGSNMLIIWIISILYINNMNNLC
jgi:hypothetical protein